MSARQQPSRRVAPAPVQQPPHRAVLTGCAVAAGFGTAWALFGASGLPTAARGPVRMLGIVAGVVIIGRSVRLRRTAPPAPTSTFRSPAYRTVVALEVAAIAGGLAALSATGHGEYVAAWVATVVGMHFLAFGRLIARLYYSLGTVVTVGGLAGALVGISGGGTASVQATSGLIAATALFTASGWRAFRPAA